MRHSARWIGGFLVFILFVTLLGNDSWLKGQTNTTTPGTVAPNRVPPSRAPMAVPNPDGSLPIRPGAVVNTGANSNTPAITQTTGRATSSQPFIPSNIPNTGIPGASPQTNPPNQPDRPPQVLPNSGQPFPPLTLQEAADLDRFLDHWEKRSSQIQYYETEFQCWEKGKILEDLNQERSTYGTIRYVAPNKGSFEVLGLVVDKKRQPAPPENQTKFLSTGDQIYSYDFAEKHVTIYTVPVDQREGIAGGGPIPFVFGAKAADLKKRYYLRMRTSPQLAERGEICLEAFPRTAEDAAEFKSVRLFFDARKLIPKAFVKVDVNEKGRETYQFLGDPKINPVNMARILPPPDIPKGWTKEEIDLQQELPQTTPPNTQLAQPTVPQQPIQQVQQVRQAVEETELYTPPTGGGNRPQF